MAFELLPLPYAKDALEPHISSETLDFHHGKHHNKYVDTTNQMIAGTEHENRSLEEIIRNSSGGLFNNAAQVWNHNFYWNSMSPNGSGGPQGDLATQIDRDFGSLDQFKEKFEAAATGQFGSGWAWLVQKSDGTLAVTNTPNAENPLTTSDNPLLTCDVWEHAYYIDYRNARPKYVESWWKVVNWDFAASNMR